MSLVRHMERLMGVDERIWKSALEWSAAGPFVITVAPDGGLRTNPTWQAQMFLGGKSKARTLEETPHGRGGAADFYPLEKGRLVLDVDDPRWEQLGVWFEARGLEWGGRWDRFKDKPHVQVPRWTSLPFPPEKPTRIA